MPDTKVSALSALTALTDDDLLLIVNDPGGTPASRKMTWANFRKAVLASGKTYVVAANGAPAKLKAIADYECDGTADQVEINAALAACASTGGRVYLTEGTFNIASSILIQQDSAFLEGAGPGARTAAADVGRGTLLKAVTGLTTAVILVQNAANDEPVFGVTIRDINVDGNSIGSAVDGIVFKSDQGLIENVMVHLCTGDGIQLEGYNGAELFDTRVSGCISSHNTGAGLFLNTYAADSRILDCTLYTNGGAGLKVKAGGCQAALGQYYNNEYGILFDGGGAQFQAQDIKIENSLKEGIYFNNAVSGASFVMIENCGFRYNCKDADNTYAVIGGTGNQQASHVQIIGCRFNSNTAVRPNLPKYNIDIWSATACLSWQIVGNQMSRPWSSHVTTSPIRNNGSTTQPALIRANTNCPDDGFLGTDTIPSGSTSVVITHNLAFTPTATDIAVTPTNSPTNDPGHMWVSNLTSTQFTVNCRTNPGAGGATFAWRIG